MIIYRCLAIHQKGQKVVTLLSKFHYLHFIFLNH